MYDGVSEEMPCRRKTRARGVPAPGLRIGRFVQVVKEQERPDEVAGGRYGGRTFYGLYNNRNVYTLQLVPPHCPRHNCSPSRKEARDNRPLVADYNVCLFDRIT